MVDFNLNFNVGYVKNTWLKFYLAAIFQYGWHLKNVLLELLSLLDFT